jgi:energy-coupling factor transporter ATP-binding protein EcfA2
MQSEEAILSARAENEPSTFNSREELGRLPLEERLGRVEHIRVFHRQFHLITEEIKRIHILKQAAAEPQCLLLVGPTGAGKTTLINSYASQFPPVITRTGLICRVLQATIPTPASEKNLAIALLFALGDPLAGRGTTGIMTQRLIKLLRDCQVEILILDELQHFVDRDSQKILQNASNWLKMVIKETNVSCVLVGLQGEAEQVVNINPQLSRLFGDPLVLGAFRWDESESATIQEFRTWLAELENLLPLAQSSHLYRRELAWRSYVATGGLVSYLMALFRTATRLALQQNRESLDLELLASAFDLRLAGQRRKLSNPFRGEVPSVNVVSLSSSPSKTAGTGTSATSGGTNRRSKARRAQSPTLKDVLS